MLYVTTRDKSNVATSYPTLTSDTAACGGLYIPFQPVSLNYDEIRAMKDKTFCQSVADVLNMFFSSKLDAWDVACCIGTNPMIIVPLSHKTTVVELWNNPEWCLSRFVRNLNCRLLGNAASVELHNWADITIRIAILTGIITRVIGSEVLEHGKTIDISLAAGDFAMPMAAWYARNMGLPIGNIIVACNDNSEVWELLHHGEGNFGATVQTSATPKCDVAIPCNIERLVYETLGEEGIPAYVNALSSKGIYNLTEEQLERFAKGMFGAVVSQSRMESVIRNVYSTKNYVLSPYSALAYGALQDYRATKGESGHALILAEEGPLSSAALVSETIGITKEALRNQLGAV